MAQHRIRRWAALFLSAALTLSQIAPVAYAQAPGTGLCEHHPQHTDACGYTEGSEGTPCNHEHTEDCYTLVTECVHEHGPECYPEENGEPAGTESVSAGTATPSEAEEQEPTECTHVCSEESGCITKVLDCKHEHDEACGYTPATEGTPCTYVCEICNPQDSGETEDAGTEDACICTEPCTEDNINEDCPGCGAEDADLTACKGEPATPSNAIDSAVTDVQASIDALPTAAELENMSQDEQGTVYEQVQAAYDAYNALTDEQKGQITGAEVFNELFAMFNGMIEPLAEGTYNLNSGSITITEDGTYTVTGSTTANTITVSSGVTATMTLQNVTIDLSGVSSATAFTIQTGANVTLILEGSSTLTSGTDGFGSGSPGIYLPSGASLTIQGSGSLTVNGGDSISASGGTGIGGNTRNLVSAAGACGTVTITSGTVNVNGGNGAAGGVAIGGGVDLSSTGGAGGTVTITGGTITAIGGDGTTAGGAGIGGGFGLQRGGAGGTVTITGGTVTVRGGSSDSTDPSSFGGAGIGGGSAAFIASAGAGGTVVILTPVTVTGGSGGDYYHHGSAIGGGQGFEADGAPGQGIRPTGTSGTYEVYGNLELPDDIEIPSGVTVTIPSSSSLTIPEGTTLTNNGTINVSGGTFTNNGTIENYGKISGNVGGNSPQSPSKVSVTVTPASATLGSTVSITATISQANSNALTRAAANQVEFFVGTGSNRKSLGTIMSDKGELPVKTVTFSNVPVTTEKGFSVGNNTITAEYGGGTGLLGNSGTATLKVTRAQLDAPTNLAWDSSTPGRATWSGVDHANGYTVRLYKDGKPQGTPVIVISSSHRFTITDAGSYTFTVMAMGDGTTYETSKQVESSALNYYTVSFDTDGGGTIDSQVVVSGSKVSKPTAPTKTGHEFGGWYKDSDLKTVWNFESDTVTAETTLYAKWTPLIYKVTLNMNGGSINDGYNVTEYTYGEGAMLPTAENMTYSGHDFGGWYDNQELTGDPVTAITATDTGEKTYYAKWTASTYKVTLETNGGTVNNGNVTEYTYGEGAMLPTDVTREGYAFAGWYEDSSFSGSEVTIIGTDATGAKTYYAKWLSTDAGVQSVVVDEKAGEINGTQITVTLPFGSTLPDSTDDITITLADGATCSTPTMNADTERVTYSFTVTAEDGTTQAEYTVTVTIAPDPATENRADVNAVKSAIERHTWTVDQATANTEEAVKAWIEEQLAGLAEIGPNDVSYTVTVTDFTAAAEGTAADRDGTNGGFAFTIVLSKGTDTGNIATSTYAEATVTVADGIITATAYNYWTVTVTAESGGTVSGGGTFEDGSTVTVTATANSGYHFVCWTENGAEVSTSESYIFDLTADRSLTAVFDRNSSGGGGSSYDYYTITATAGEGGSISPSGSTRVREGHDQTYTITPDGGYRISDVRVDGVSVGAVSSYTFDNVQKRHTIEAIFAKENPDMGNPFTDVHPDDWFYNDVMFVYQNGLMAGTSDTTFSPEGTTTRGQIVTILWRLSGSPVVNYLMDFSDVDPAAYYGEAIRWATSEGIVGGYGGGVFGPSDPVTREQLAAILYRYAQHEGCDTTQGGMAIREYADDDQISDFAREALNWAVNAGIINGTSATTLSPSGSATRAQAAVMLEQFSERFVEN